jgi:nucleotide-binding universal stress UspA family protein
MTVQARADRASGRALGDSGGESGGGGRPGHTVVGFDGSAASYDAVAFARGWVRRVGATLDIIYVADAPWQWAGDGGWAGSCADTVGEVASSLSVELAAAMAGSAMTWTWSYLASSGDIATELERCAENLGADAIIVGHSHKRLFSIGRRLVRRAKRIVIVVP